MELQNHSCEFFYSTGSINVTCAIKNFHNFGSPSPCENVFGSQTLREFFTESWSTLIRHKLSALMRFLFRVQALYVYYDPRLIVNTKSSAFLVLSNYSFLLLKRVISPCEHSYSSQTLPYTSFHSLSVSFTAKSSLHTSYYVFHVFFFHFLLFSFYS